MCEKTEKVETTTIGEATKGLSFSKSASFEF
jgi:hypothetical protein